MWHQNRNWHLLNYSKSTDTKQLDPAPKWWGKSRIQRNNWPSLQDKNQNNIEISKFHAAQILLWKEWTYRSLNVSTMEKVPYKMQYRQHKDMIGKLMLMRLKLSPKILVAYVVWWLMAPDRVQLHSFGMRTGITAENVRTFLWRNTKKVRYLAVDRGDWDWK